MCLLSPRLFATTQNVIALLANTVQLVCLLITASITPPAHSQFKDEIANSDVLREFNLDLCLFIPVGFWIAIL
jgi:hypothetical protein